MRPKFQIYGNAATGYRWRFRAANGEIVASGEAYRQKAGAQHAVNILRTYAPNAMVEDLT